MVIAVDGPAASGKGTVARALARHYGLPHMDTGLLYRRLALAVIHYGSDPTDGPAAARLVPALDHASHENDELRAESTGAVASVVSAHPAVRAALLDRQRAFAAQSGGAVLDGRDIGTVIAPHAPAKLFVTALPETRARRRHAELGGSYDAVLADILARDSRDLGRGAAPLRRADDAALLDTTDMSIAAAVQRAIALVEAALGGTAR